MSRTSARRFGVFASGVFLVASVFLSACADSGDEEPADSAPQPPVTSEAVEPTSASDAGVFLRVVAPLDEERGYCIDIPGHLSGVQLDSPLHAHTCKHGIWNQDGRFDVAALGKGELRMPHYELCLQAEEAAIGAQLVLAQCTRTELQAWSVQDSGQIALQGFPDTCITVEDAPGRDAGGPQYRMKSVGLDTCAEQADDRQRWTTAIPR